MPRTCRFKGNYNVAKKLKQDTKTIMTNRKMRRGELKKDQTRRKKERVIKPSIWTMEKLAQMAETIMKLGSKYVLVIYELVKTYHEWQGEIYSLKYLEPNTLHHLDSLLQDLVEEEEMNLGDDYRFKVAKLFEKMSKEMIPAVEKIYKVHIRQRANTHYNGVMDIAFPFPIKGLKEMERVIKKEKQHQYYLSRK